MSTPFPLLDRSFWETACRAVLVFESDWMLKELPSVYWGPTGDLLQDIAPMPPKALAEWQAYYVEGNEVVFTLIPKDYPYVGWEKERIYLVGPFNDWDHKSNEHWAFHKRRESGHERWVLRLALEKLQVLGEEAIPFKAVSARGIWLAPNDRFWNRQADSKGNINWVFDPKRKGRQAFYFNAPKSHQPLAPAWVEHEAISRKIEVDALLLSLSSQIQLGALVEGKKTTFRLFAPRAKEVKVYFRKNHSEERVLALKKVENGVWEGLVNKNLHGYEYDYTLDGDKDATLHFDPSRRVLDPYAQLVTQAEGSGIVLDLSQVPKPTACYYPPAWQRLIIAEAHVRDLVAKVPGLSEQERKGFVGLTEWLQKPDCYWRQLGINAIELQPIQAFDGNLEDYHWGYMPINYFSPAPAYLKNPNSVESIKECQELVKAFHDAGIAVILDVVYNHAGNPNPFYFIDKQYYLRSAPSGHLENWSGCGNDLRAEAPMVKRLIIESLVHWVRYYDVDGFRFDLADLLGVAVLEEIEKALKAVKPSIILIAEPWSFRGHIAAALKHTGWSSWNDGYRDFLANYVLGQEGTDGLSYYMMGSSGYLTCFPAQTVNYVESHDDLTWIDKITENEARNGKEPTLHDIRRSHLMFAILMSSLGIPMISAGQEFLRSKGGLGNTYQQGDVNALDYDHAEDNPGTQAYLRHWISLRHSAIGQRYFCHEKTPNQAYFHVFKEEGSNAMGLLYNANGSQGRKRLLFVVNPHLHALDFPLPGLDPHAYKQLADQERVDWRGLEPPFMRWAEGAIHLPALSCALFEGY